MKKYNLDEDVANTIFCIKFFSKEEYARAFMSGNLYANTLRYFIEEEEKTGVRGQGDRYELQYSLPLFDLQVKDPESKNILFTIEKASGKIQNDQDLDYHVICCCGFKIKDMIQINSESKTIFKFPFSDEEYVKLKETFGPYFVLFFEQDFVESVHRNYKNGGPGYLSGQVIYAESNSEEKAIAHFQGNMEKFLYKNKDLEYQKEYRCVFFYNGSNEIHIDNFCNGKLALGITDNLKNVSIVLQEQ